MELLLIMGFTFVLIIFGFRFYAYKTMTKKGYAHWAPTMNTAESTIREVWIKAAILIKIVMWFTVRLPAEGLRQSSVIWMIIIQW